MPSTPTTIVHPDERLDERCERHFPAGPGARVLDASHTRVVIAFADCLRMVDLESEEVVWEHSFKDQPDLWFLRLVGDAAVFAAGDALTSLGARGETLWKIELEGTRREAPYISATRQSLTLLEDETFRVFDLSSGELLEEVDAAEDYRLGTRDSYAALLPVGDALLAPTNSELTIWRDGGLDQAVFRSGVSAHYDGNPTWIVSPGETKVAVLAAVMGGIDVFDIEDLGRGLHFNLSAVDGLFLDENRLLIWMPDYVALVEVASGQTTLRKAPWPGHRSAVVLDECRALTISPMGSICLWDVSTFPVVEAIPDDAHNFLAVSLGDTAATETIVFQGRTPRRLVGIDHETSARTVFSPEFSERTDSLMHVASGLYALQERKFGHPEALLLWERGANSVRREEFDRVLSTGPGFALVAEGALVRRLRLPHLEVEHEWVAPEGAVVESGFASCPQLVQLCLEDGGLVVHDIDANRRVTDRQAVLNGDLLVTMDWHPVTYQQRVNVWNIEGNRIGQIDGSEVSLALPCGRVRCVFFSDYEGRLWAWRPDREPAVLFEEPEHQLSPIFFVSRDGRWLVAVADRILLWHTDHIEAPRHELQLWDESPGLIDCQNDRLFVSDRNGLFAIYELG